MEDQPIRPRRMTSAPRTALVVGGGIGGLAAAIALRQIGVEATVCERTHALGEVGAGIALWPNATRALARLGVLDAVRDAAGPVSGVEIRSADGRRLSAFSASGYATPALCVHRADLVAVLRDALPAGEVRFGCEYAAHTDDAEGVSVRFADESEQHADLLVGADGLRSGVRASIGAAEAPRFCGQTVVRGVSPRLTRPGEAFETWGDGLRFGLFDVGQDRAYWYAVEAAAEAPRSAAVDRGALLRRFALWHSPISATIEATPEDALTRYAVHDRTPRRGWSEGRAVLVGDAAHPMTPDMGQGGAQALEDAVALAEAVRRASDVSGALRQFERARYARTARLVWQSRIAGQVGQASGAAARLRDGWIRLAPEAAFARGFTWPFGVS